MINYASLQQTFPSYNQSYQNSFSFGSQQNNTSIFNSYNSPYAFPAMQQQMMMPQQQNSSTGFMQQLIMMLLPLLLGNIGHQSTSITEEETIIEDEEEFPEFAQVNSPATNANANVNGHGKTMLVNDVGGTNNNYVSGHDNRVEFIGDADVNNFHVNGEDNEVSVYNIGADDTVFLKGNARDWEIDEIPQSGNTRGSSHYVVFHNTKTGTYVKAASDRGSRDENWIKSRIVYE
ncbi:MAG: hypothetical protein A2039_02915 [Candidatus Melainabacteria bacterium GWA2_34_9]|nr:MAG: hypothetical protein A2039_02915 [Candidatus Melainabacteria bacterium GWA2_34_9]